MNFLKLSDNEIDCRAESIYKKQLEIKKLINNNNEETDRSIIKKFRKLRDKIEKDRSDLRKVSDDIIQESELGKYYDFIHGITFENQKNLSIAKVADGCWKIRYCYKYEFEKRL